MLAKYSNKLVPPELEARFRVEGLQRDTVVATGLMLFAFLFHVISFPTDLELLGRSEALTVVWAVRGASAVIALVCLLLIRRTSGVSSFDNIVFLWAALLGLGIVLANGMLPADYTTHVAWDLFLAFAAYAVVPLPLNRQVMVASIVTLGDIVIFWQFKALDQPGAFLDVLTAFVCANLVGVFTSWEFQRWRRRGFLALRREADARADLEKAWLEIKTLKGIIPICANCKKVRTDEGHWNQVEAYVRDHSEADFSHGICPDCAAILYPELSAEDLKDIADPP
ncbi:hypothetical protein ACFL3Z_01695 [Gemmatimonadota bacterium]